MPTERRVSHFAVILLLPRALALVVELAAPGHGQGELGKPAGEKDRQGDERQPLLFRGLGDLLELAFPQQELPRPLGLMVYHVGLRVKGDVAVDEPQLSVVDAGVGLFDRNLAVADALHFAADQDDAAFDLVQNVVLVPRPPIAAHGRRAGISFGRLLASHAAIIRRSRIEVLFPKNSPRKTRGACTDRTRPDYNLPSHRGGLDRGKDFPAPGRRW